MYIVYERNQREIKNTDGFVDQYYIKYGFNPPLRKSGVLLSIFQFKPTWLVRVSDMKRIPGSIVDDYYWALSYSWCQSGDILCKASGEYERIDKSKHTIVQKYNTLGQTPEKQVKFEQLIQQICKDFGIKYIWFDQMCIDQNDQVARAREIRQMHRIYKCARCTLALIPELMFTGTQDKNGDDITDIDVISDSQWSKRMWTLEEAYMSRDILFVGRNVHLWSYRIQTRSIRKCDAFIRNIIDKEDYKWKACTALWYTRTRTSSKAHDRVFALFNIFPDLQGSIKLDYHQPVQDLMLRFYCLLAKKDYSILLFASPADSGADKEMLKVRQKEARTLPSWSGVNGVHIPQSSLYNENAKLSFSYIINDEFMSLTSDFIIAHMEPETSIEGTEDFAKRHYYYLPPSWLSSKYKCISVEHGAKIFTFAATSRKSQCAYNHYTKHFGLDVTHFLPVKDERIHGKAPINTLSSPNCIGGLLSLTEDSNGCIILTGLEFKVSHFRCYPVIKKNNGYYRSIGLCFFESNLDLDHMIQPPRTFCIQ